MFRNELEKSTREFLRLNRVYLIGVGVIVMFFIYVLLNSNQGDTLVYINRLRSEFWDTFFIITTRAAEPEAYLLLIIAASAYRYRTALFILITGILSGLISGIFKAIFAQARPMRWFFDNYEEIWHSLNLFSEDMRSWAFTSFPSGHATSAFALYGFLSYNLHKRKDLYGLLAITMAAIIALSRMYLLYHFLRDVTAGAVLGLFIGLALYGAQFRFYPDSKFWNRGWWHDPDQLPEIDDEISSRNL